MDQPTKVLILSGDARVREPAAEVLLRGGFVVDEATDVASALEAVREHDRAPDIVLADATGGEDLTTLLSSLARELPESPPRTVLLASHRTPMSLREHPSVVYVLDAPAAVRSLISLADWIGERDPHTRPSLTLKPLCRVAASSPATRSREAADAAAGRSPS